jgi:hypothetical protein
LIVDEVAVLENPILQRFLSEARKYNLSLILAGQYFDQISNPLKKSIFANAANFFTFRVSREDSALLSDHLSMKTDANKIDILSTLKDRELVARVSSGGVLTTAFKARTLDFIPKPPKIVTLRPAEIENVESTIKAAFDFDASTTTSIHEIMLAQSTGRKKIENGR